MLMTDRNRIDISRDDTLITKATGEELQKLSKIYGLEWILGRLTAPEQQHFLKNTLYTPRGTFLSFFNSIRAFFSKLEIELENVNVLVGNSVTTLSHAYITEGYQSKIIEIDNNGSKTIHKVKNSSIGVLTLDRAKNFMQGQIEGSFSATVRVLPFELFEILPASSFELSESHPCKVILEIDQYAFQNVPATYLRENADARTNDPFGGHILDLFDNDLSIPSAGNQVDGPFPLYLDGEGEVSTTIKTLFQDLLPTSITLEIKSRNFNNSPFEV